MNNNTPQNHVVPCPRQIKEFHRLRAVELERNVLSYARQQLAAARSCANTLQMALTQITALQLEPLPKD